MFKVVLLTVGILFGSMDASALNLTGSSTPQTVPAIKNLKGGIMGSSVVIGQNKSRVYLLTAWHITAERINPTGTIPVYKDATMFINGSKVDVEYSLRDVDLALVSIPKTEYKYIPLPIARSIPNRLRTVWAVGYPAGEALVVTEGMLQYGYEEEVIATADIFYGSSGGALVVCDGRKVENKVVQECSLLGIASRFKASGKHAATHLAIFPSLPAIDRLFREYEEKRIGKSKTPRN